MRLTLLSCLILGITTTIQTQAEIITVCPDGSCDFTSIQMAIDEAGSGDRIEIAAGTYRPRSTIQTDGKAITLFGDVDSSGEPSTILDGQGFRRVFRCDDNETAATVIENLAFVNGRSSAGAGVRIDHSSPTFINCRMEGNFSTGSGAGLYLYNARPMLMGCAINDNECEWSGGGIAIYDNSNPILVDTIICGNIAFWKDSAQIEMDGGSGWTDDGENCIREVCDDCEAGPDGDLNDDGRVDGADLGLLLVHWGESGITDLNQDSTTDGGDVGLLLTLLD